MGPDPAVAAVRLAVRRVLADLPAGSMTLVACSGGADSLALAGALAFEAPRAGLQAGGITIDHGLQEGSGARADAVVRTLADLGLDPAGSVAVTVDGEGGMENAARNARYAALDRAAGRLSASAVLLGHTRDDQAETVLLGLARGSGARSLAGMPPALRRSTGRGEALYLRPLLDLDRATMRRACLAMGLEPWDDPHNDDPAYTRVRVRHRALPVLEETLGPGVAEALARTARMLRDDADALDALAARAYDDLLDDAFDRDAFDHDGSDHDGSGHDAAGHADASRRDDAAGHDDEGPTVAIRVDGLEELHRALRTRVLRMAAVKAGSPPGTLAAVHVDAMDRLVTAWHGQRHVDLPGGLRVFRRYGRLLFGPV